MDAADLGFGGEAADAQQACSVRPRWLLAWAFSSLMLAGLVTGCAVGPDFTRPEPPEVSRYTVAPLPAQTASATTPLGEAQQFRLGEDVDAQWWKKLG